MKAPVVVYAAAWRAVAAVLVAISRTSLLLMLAALLFLDVGLDNPLRLVRIFVTASIAPGLAAWLLGRVFAADATIEDHRLVLRRRDQRMEIPCEAITRLEPWTMPSPAGGVWLRLRSGRRFPYGVQTRDPFALAEALAEAGAAPTVRIDEAHEPAAVYARSRLQLERRWYHPVLAFVVFALVPTVPLFRLHQWIAYGGTFGEYYIYGLQAYLLGFAIYWATFTIHLVLYAAILRTVAELVVIAGVFMAPDRVVHLRQRVEVARRVLYFGGVFAFLARVALST